MSINVLTESEVSPDLMREWYALFLPRLEYKEQHLSKWAAAHSAAFDCGVALLREIHELRKKLGEL